MKINQLHSWDVTPESAIQLQKELRKNLQIKNSFDPESIRYVAGCDMAIDPEKNLGVAGVLVYSWPNLRLFEKQSAVLPLTFPYVPGLLSFREIPVLSAAIAKLQHEPDLFFFDGQGIAHPRGMGIAAHMGLILNKPTIGCGKSRLYGDYEEPANEKGATSPLYSKEKQIIGTVLRTKPNCNPIFISPGNKIDLTTSLDLVLPCLDGYRIPKPTREADIYVGKLKPTENKEEQITELFDR